MEQQKPEMSLADFRSHCEKAHALPILQLIDRILYLSVMGEKVLARTTCTCKPNENEKFCVHCEVHRAVKKHGYGAPLK